MNDSIYRIAEDIIATFVGHTFQNFQQMCAKREITPNPANLLDYIIQHNLITEETIRHYVILCEYESLMSLRKYKNKTTTIKAISTRLSVHENTIWNVLKDHKNKFQKRYKLELEENGVGE